MILKDILTELKKQNTMLEEIHKLTVKSYSRLDGMEKHTTAIRALIKLMPRPDDILQQMADDLVRTEADLAAIRGQMCELTDCLPAEEAKNNVCRIADALEGIAVHCTRADPAVVHRSSDVSVKPDKMTEGINNILSYTSMTPNSRGDDD